MNALSRATDRIDLFRRRLLWHRRPLAAVAAAAAAYAALHAATAPPPSTVGVWTASRDLPSGTVLTRDALVRRPFTPQSVPPARISTPDQVLGRTLAAPLAQGAVVAPDSVVSDGWLVRHPGLVAVPVRLTDPAVVPLLRVGDRVSLLAADPQHPGAAQPLADPVTVLAVPAARAQADGSLPGRLVLLGVPSSSADLVAAASAARYLTVTWTH